MKYDKLTQKAKDFAQACINNNDINELWEPHTPFYADEIKCNKYGITADEWSTAIDAALEIVQKDIRVTKSDYNLNLGFFYINFTYGQDTGYYEKEYHLQACLEPRQHENGYKKEIRGDGGIVDGICGDANTEAYTMFGYGLCCDIIMKAARKQNIKIVD